MLVAVITIFARLCKGAIKTKNVGNGKSVYMENQTSIASKSRGHLQRPNPKPELKRQADVRQVSDGPESFKGVSNKMPAIKTRVSQQPNGAISPRCHAVITTLGSIPAEDEA
jgi:hypothetical protein